MKKKILFLVTLLMVLFLSVMSSQAAGASSAWYFDGINWHVKGPDGQMLRNCWFCDDAVFENGQNIWYLLDGFGNMVASPLVKDARGNYYSLETNHNGVYGSLRYMDGTYDGVTIKFNSNHNGNFGAIKNQEAIDELQWRYGVQDISYISTVSYYSSSWLGTPAAPVTAPSYGPNFTNQTVVDDNVQRTLTFLIKGKPYKRVSGNTRYFTIIQCDEDLLEGTFDYWTDEWGKQYYPGDMFVFEGNILNDSLSAVAQ